MLNMFASKKEQADQSRRIKQWLRDALELPEQVMILVAEMACNDPACLEETGSPVETVITVWYTDTHNVKAKIFKPLATVAYDDIGQVMYQLTR
jgi:hypothetical protein